MSNKQKVWVSFIDDISVVKTYSIALNFPTMYRYLDDYALDLKAKKIKDQTEKEKFFQENQMPFVDRRLEIQQNYGGCILLPEQPNKMYLVQRPIPKKKDYLFCIKGAIKVVNQSCADILKQFNLGNTVLAPVQLYDRDTDLPIKDDMYYVLNIAESREFTLQEQNNQNFEYKEWLGSWYYKLKSFYAKSEDKSRTSIINLSIKATDCEVDLWRETKVSGDLFFMSDRLHNALVKAKQKELWNTQPCTLI